MGRNQVYTDDTKVAVRAARSKSRLQQGSDRRAIINHLIDVGGQSSLLAIDEHFGYEIRTKVAALLKTGWLEVVE